MKEQQRVINIAIEATIYLYTNMAVVFRLYILKGDDVTHKVISWCQGHATCTGGNQYVSRYNNRAVSM